jgi:GDP-L-fucose synthase
VDFITGIPANIFGPGDDFSLEDSHVVSALMRRTHEAKTHVKSSLDIWGTGKPVREFIFVDDLANACIFVMNSYSGTSPVNLGSGHSVSMEELASAIKEITQYPGTLRFDTTKPDGMPVKILDTGTLRKLGWQPRFPFGEALMMTYQWYLDNIA